MGEAPFQTNTHLSLKKTIKKRETQDRTKASNHLFTEQKNRKKKKKKEAKTLQTTRAYQLKKNNNNRNKHSTILKKSALYSGNKRNPPPPQKKKEAKTLKPKTSSPIKIHTRSAYRLFSVS